MCVASRHVMGGEEIDSVGVSGEGVSGEGGQGTVCSVGCASGCRQGSISVLLALECWQWCCAIPYITYT